MMYLNVALMYGMWIWVLQNHMTSHGEWFQDMHDPERPGYVETSDDTTHPIAHVGNVPLSMQDGKVKYLA